MEKKSTKETISVSSLLLWTPYGGRVVLFNKAWIIPTGNEFYSPLTEKFAHILCALAVDVL